MAGNIAKAQELASKGNLNVQQIARRADISPTRAERIVEQTPAKPATPTYTGSLAQYAAPGGFGAGAYMRAQEAGLTEPEIRQGVEELRRQGMPIGARVETAVQGPGGAFSSGSSMDAGSEMSYGFRPVFMPGQEGVGERGKGVFFAAGPMTNQQVINMLQGKPRESYVLPASTRSPQEGYRAPAGTPYVDVTASPAEQARQAVAGLNIPQLQTQAKTKETTTKETKAKETAPKAASQSILQSQRKQPATQARAGQLLNTWIQSVIGKKQTQKDTDWNWLYARNPSMKSYFS